MADVINISQALEIATVSQDSQTEFFEAYCSDWKKEKNFELRNLGYYLDQYRYDLKQAPFNTKDKKLLPEVGACMACPSNTATLKTLFPEYARQAICNNKECYQQKCSAHFVNQCMTAFSEHNPSALLFNGAPSPLMERILSLVPGGNDLPKHDRHEVTIVQPPQCPEPDDYVNYSNEDGREWDEEGFSQATDEYHADLETYNLKLQSGHFKKALFIDNREFRAVMFSPEPPPKHNGFSNTVTAKDVHAAIKAGKATPELLQAEIDRINSREKRSLELDREKIQATIHEKFADQNGDVNNVNTLTAAGQVAARLLVYQTLDYSSRDKVNEVLFASTEDGEEKENLYVLLSNLTDTQYSYLIRMAITRKPESKYPTDITAYCLYQMAGQAGTGCTRNRQTATGKDQSPPIPPTGQNKRTGKEDK